VADGDCVVERRGEAMGDDAVSMVSGIFSLFKVLKTIVVQVLLLREEEKRWQGQPSPRNKRTNQS
jgi:hypothetical protein